MMPDEKARLLTLLNHAGKWCRNAEGLDASGNGVVYNDDEAVAFDIMGVLGRLSGWQRACVLFGQLDRHLRGTRIMFGLAKTQRGDGRDGGAPGLQRSIRYDGRVAA